MSTITAANSVYMLSVGGIFPVAQQLEGYNADAAFATDSVQPSETVLGVDGKMSAGFIPFLTMQTISIMPDSPSLFIFDTWLAAQKAAREVFFADATIILPAIGRKYALTRGVLSAIKAIPDAKKVLQATDYQITWQDVSPALI